ncbi:flagellar hook-length control protein FliK [Undibacterium sp.]|jgi:hypothetical protein|uniref:flagellar hook-length control protein FliK n=1 Tax=Undibacterium sp. TaxID=1914977 RepID=UPI002C2AB572|nr:flagellar hook-length control protein FliK [Undibacterium sp.]HTD03758.1 flagellar hook-length control protein FliK [Undibacterium sp.]
MALARVTAIVLPQAVRDQPGANGRAAQLKVGETVQLTLDEAGANELLAKTPDGLPLRLAGLDSLASRLSPGDVLQLRVLAIAPQLELAILNPSEHAAADTAAKPVADAGADQSAMRLDQAVLSRQIVWRTPDAAALATSWRVMVLSFFQQQDALREQARGQHVPGGLLMADMAASTLRPPPNTLLNMDAESWLFAAYTWNGQKLMLRVLGTDEDEPAQRKGPRSKIALRVEFLLPELGLVNVQMELAAGGVLLDLAAEQPEAMQHLRQALRGLASAIARSGLSIVRCRLSKNLPAISTLNSMRAEAGIAGMRPELFRAMAEVIVFLIQPQS